MFDSNLFSLSDRICIYEINRKVTRDLNEILVDFRTFFEFPSLFSLTERVLCMDLEFETLKVLHRVY